MTEEDRHPSDAERRQLTVLFCDLAGSTERSAALDPEEWREIVARYQRAASAEVERFEGYVAQLLGDGLLVYFGWPRAHDDDAERAVRAGLGLVDAVRAVGVGLRVRVGIHTGPVVVSALDAGSHSETLALGEVPNLAARVQAAAAPDSVCITAATHRLVTGLFVVEEVGAHTLKGIAKPVALFRVIQPSGVRGRLRASATRTPFVGREDERRLLRSRFERAHEGEGQVVLIAGEAGIGKSRLVEVLREDLAGTPHSWIECACSPYHTNTPFFPVVDMLQHALAFRGDEPPSERVGQLERALAFAGLEPTQTIPLVAPLLGLPVPEHLPPLLLTPEQQRKRLLATLVAWVRGMARLQPLVIVTEDLHWEDPSSLELQGLLVEQGATAPLLLLFTARPEFRAPWPMRGHHAQITLARLPRREARELLEQATLREALASELIEAVLARADGVPLFVEELVRLMLEGGGRDVAHEIPSSLQDLLMARLDRLGPAKEVAQVASAIGREFSYALLRAVSALPNSALDAALAALADAELVYARGLPPDASYVFKHALVQDAAHASLLKSRRRELHGAIARALVEKFPMAVEAHPEQLAHHWTEAGAAAFAVEAWRRAAERSAARSADIEAAAQYRRAIEVLGSLPDSPERAQQELLLQLALGPVLFTTKGWASPEVAEAYRRARELGEQIGDPTQLLRVLLGAWTNALTRGELRAARELADQVLRAAERDGRPRSLVWAHFVQGTTRHYQGELASSLDHFTRADALLGAVEPETGDPGVPVLAFGANTLHYLGRLDAARERAAESLARARKLGRTYELGIALITLSFASSDRRESVAEELDRIAAEHGFPVFSAAAMFQRGQALVRGGRFDEAIPLLQGGIARTSATGLRLTHALWLAQLATAQLGIGALDDAEATIEDAFASAREERVWLPDVLRVRGDLLARRADAKGAEVSYREALAEARRSGARFFALQAATSLGRLLLAQERAAEAREILAPVYASFTEGFDTRALLEAKALLDELG